MKRPMPGLESLRGPRPLIMGILNATPDSFSDGGLYLDPGLAARHARRMAEEGADIIDVGGESTRPGSERVAAAEQLARVVPVIEALRQALPENVLISIDTTRAEVAEAALAAGAQLVNDISAGRDDPRIFECAARHRAPIALMHMQGEPKTMQDAPSYRDVAAEVLEFLEGQALTAQAAGIPPENIILDPGIGFGKCREDNLRLLAELGRFVASGYPVLLGTSRKRFMGAICGESRPTELLGATVATTALGVAQGVKIFRVHDIRPNRQAADVAAAIWAAAHGDRDGRA
jgi:dihydropteroate synthase